MQIEWRRKAIIEKSYLLEFAIEIGFKRFHAVPPFALHGLRRLDADGGAGRGWSERQIRGAVSCSPYIIGNAPLSIRSLESAEISGHQAPREPCGTQPARD